MNFIEQLIANLLGIGITLFILIFLFFIAKRRADQQFQKMFSKEDEILRKATTLYGREPYPSELLDILKMSDNLNENEINDLIIKCKKDR